MLEKALTGSKNYWTWVTGLLILIGIGFGCYLWQFNVGLKITGLSRDVSWGFYIAQLTFLVGVAASAVMLVLPYYIHNYKTFGRITVLGEFLAVSAVTMCILFVFVDLGKPMRILNTLLHPTPNSILFWDIVVLNGYLGLNIVIGWAALGAEKKGVAPPFWTKPLIYISIPWAVSIHTVTAFLYAGLPGRHLWLTAIMAPRFLASAFAAGPALLILLALLIRRVTKFDPGEEAIGKLATITTYAAILNLFFVGLEFFTAFYSGIPSHQHSLTYLFAGLDGHGALVPWLWASMILGVASVISLLIIKGKGLKNYIVLAWTCAALFISLWIDKGIGLVVGGFIPNPLEQVREYAPTAPELLISLAIYAIGALMLTVFYKISLAVKEESGGEPAH